MQQTRAAVVGGAGHSQLTVKQQSKLAKSGAARLAAETRFVLSHLHTPRGLLRAKTTRLQLGNYLCVASK